MKKNKKSIKTMDLILIIICMVLVIFTISMINIFIHQGAIPDTLVSCVFAACTGELGIMGWIKTVKDKYTDNDRIDNWVEEEVEVDG